MVKNLTIKIVTVFIAVVILFVGNKYVSENLDIFKNQTNGTAYGEVTEIVNREVNVFSLSGSEDMQNVDLTFKCKVKNGEHKGEVVEVNQNVDPMLIPNVREVEVGDTVIILNTPNNTTGELGWNFAYYSKTRGIVILTLIFIFLMFLLLRSRGFNIIISLAITCAAIFLVLVPAILNGFNIYTVSLFVCLFITITTLIILNGWNKKTLATIIGCFAGVMTSGVITIIMNKALMLSGMIDEHSIYISMMNPDNPIDLLGIVFASIVIGALGAVMDVAMDISSASYELSKNGHKMTRGKLLNSSLQIGRDIMGTMSNTLILAYIGSSLTSILLMVTYAGSVTELLNRETVVIEILQALIGSTAIVLTIPITAIVCSIFYVTKQNKKEVDL